MKVLCFGRFYDDIPGGMQKHIEHLFASLQSQVNYIHLVPSRDHESASFSLHGAPVFRTPSLNIDGSLALSPALIMKAHQLHKQHQFDIIHLHFPDPMSHMASMVLPKYIPRIITWHADITRQKILSKIYSPFQNRALNNASAIIAPTPAHIKSSRFLPPLVNQNKTHIIPFGFDLKKFTTPHPETEHIKNKFTGKLIFALGRHVYYKGFDVLIKAMHQTSPSVQLIIGGTGPLTEKWQSLVNAENLADRVHFIGLISEKSLPAYYQAADIFCLPAVSQAEAFGIVQVEAMACGKPVVSTQLNNGVDFVNQDGITGVTVPPGNVDKLSEALNRLLNNQNLCDTLGKQAKERAINEFSLQAMGNKTLHLYNQVTHKHQSLHKTI